MTPQASFMLVSAIRPQREGELRALLASMTKLPGQADPENALIPFGVFEQLHFARFVILDDRTTGDLAVHGVTPIRYPLALAFLADYDGDTGDFLRDFTQRGGSGLRRIFTCCDGFTDSTDLLAWVREHEHGASASYVNWRGRTMRTIREEAALSTMVAETLRADPRLRDRAPRELHAELRQQMQRACADGRLTLSAEVGTPLSWRIQNTAHFLAPFVVVVLAAVLLLALLPWGIVLAAVIALLGAVFVILRRRERTDPEVAPRVDPAHAARLATLEDHDVTNQFSAMGSLKPGVFRRWLVIVVLWGLDWTTRHVYVRGRLARVNTIHAARWVFLDGKRRMLFASNYDGSLESYMDDFINKVAFGLNLVFSNGVGYPATAFLVLRGAKDEQKFKWFIRRHELPTEVWYNGHPGLTALRLQRNTRLRKGLEADAPSDTELLEWCRLL